MQQSTKSPPQLNSHLRAIRDEDAPSYVASSSDKRHMTVIEDDVIESIAESCGLSALGLYTLLERRANSSGYAFGSYQDWSEMAGMTRRHVIRLMDQLVAGGWVKKEERANQFGMQKTNAWNLPFHRKASTYRGDIASDINGDIASDITSDMTRAFMSPLKSSSKVVTEVVDKVEIPPSPPTSTYPEDFEEFWAMYPKKRQKGEALKAWNASKKLRPPMDMLLRSLAQQRRSKDWTKEDGQFVPNPATWLNRRSWDDSAEVTDPWNPPGMATIEELLAREAIPGMWIPDEYKARLDAYKSSH